VRDQEAGWLARPKDFALSKEAYEYDTIFFSFGRSIAAEMFSFRNCRNLKLAPELELELVQ